MGYLALSCKNQFIGFDEFTLSGLLIKQENIEFKFIIFTTSNLKMRAYVIN